MKRNQDRPLNQLREVSLEINTNIHAEGSVLVSFGNTKVICTASIENNVPRWMKNSNEGWITAEYGMLPRSTNERMSRLLCIQLGQLWGSQQLVLVFKFIPQTVNETIDICTMVEMLSNSFKF